MRKLDIILEFLWHHRCGMSNFLFSQKNIALIAVEFCRITLCSLFATIFYIVEYRLHGFTHISRIGG